MLFEYLNKELFDNKIKLKEKNFILKCLLPNVAISFFNCILVDNVKNISNTTVLHEISHLIERCDYNKYKFKISFFKTIKFYVTYMFPQILSLFSILSVFNLWFLLFILFLIPNPILSSKRKNIEMRGYFWNWYINATDYNFSKIFSGMLYFKMDFKHDIDYYSKAFKKMYSELYFSNNNSDYFKMFILLTSYRNFIRKL